MLAALLAPTDAALGQAVVSAKIVPVRIRQTINIESGLNDGIALPVVLWLTLGWQAALKLHLIPVFVVVPVCWRAGVGAARCGAVTDTCVGNG